MAVPRYRSSSMRIDTLRALSTTLHDDATEDDKSIDFSSVGLYLAGLQTCFAIVCCGCVSVLCCWLMPESAISAVRTLAITATVGMLLVRSPVRVGPVRGIVTVFNALRPCVPMYILALTVEQLVHTCVPADGATFESRNTLTRRIIYHAVCGLLVISGFVRARSPRSESDVPFLLSVICLLVIALLPPPAIAQTGPLCEPASLMGAGERVLRALLFAAVYTVLVYAAAPQRNQSNELFICVARATAASVWVLCSTAWLLPLAPIQVVIVLCTRLAEAPDTYAVDPLGQPTGAFAHNATNYYSNIHTEHVPLTALGSQTPVDSYSDAELGDVGHTVTGTPITDPDSVRLALASTVRPISGHGALTLSFAPVASASTNSGLAAQNIAAIVARESAQM